MTRLQQDIDDLDRMADGSAAKDAIRSQIRLIGREVAALEADYARLAEEYAKLQASQPPPLADMPVDSFEPRRGLYYKLGDAIPFCPICWDTSNGSKKIHLSGPVPMMDETIEYWECHICDKDFSAKPRENFLAKPARPGRRR